MQPEHGAYPDGGQLVEVETKFHRESVRAGGISRDAALQRAGEVLDAARPELDERIFSALEAAVPLIENAEKDEQAGRELTGELREHARELRDFGALAGFPCVSAVAAMLVNVLSGILDGRMKYRADVVMCYMQSLSMFCAKDKRHLSTLECPALLEELGAMQDRLLPEDEPA